MPLSLAQFRTLFFLFLLGACANQPSKSIDTSQLAREIIAEERQKAIEPLPPAKTARTPVTASTVSADPIWQLTGDTRGLQHLTSGYICPAQIGDFQMLGEEAFPGLGHGRDVACIYAATQGGSIKLHLTDFGRDVSPSAHLKGVVTTIADNNRATREIPAPATTERPVTQNSVAFQIPAVSKLRPEVPMQTAVWIEQFDVWHLKIRATYEADRTEAIATATEAFYARAKETILPPSRLELPKGLDD